VAVAHRGVAARLRVAPHPSGRGHPCIRSERINTSAVLALVHVVTRNHLLCSSHSKKWCVHEGKEAAYSDVTQV
jgi:hypothetical protein